MAFLGSESNPCPNETWELFEDAKGRFIIGAGNSTGNLKTRIIGETGGDQ